jgi:hypothetical protein
MKDAASATDSPKKLIAVKVLFRFRKRKAVFRKCLNILFLFGG